MEQFRSNGEQRELRDEVVDLGTRYGIVTPYTSFLALEPGAQVREITSLPTMQRSPRGFAAGNAPAAPAAEMNAATGRVAVEKSKAARRQQEAERDDARTVSAVVRSVAGKTFYLIDGVWTDGEFRSELQLPENKVKFGSDEYFTLINSKPALAEFFALGEQVVVVFEGRVYRVTG
jgi:Ca-activated chloride channel family protein